MKTQVCPSVSDLVSFRAGLLSLDTHFAVAKHLKTCPICIRKVQNFAGPTLLNAVDSVEITLTGDATLPAIGTTPTQLGPYILHRVLGRGGMGIVYEAEHVKLRNRVALKLLPKATLSDPASLARFRHEWEAVGRLAHPNVVRALHADEADGVPFLAMEYINGPDVAMIVALNGPVCCADAAEIVRQAALGLAHAHDRGVIHRDVKPNNLLLTNEGQVKLLDLGLARFAGGDSMRSAQQFLGTADYMAPEQWQGQTTDTRTDVYSLGCVLYFLLTGRPPFSSTRFPSTRAKMLAHAECLPAGVTAPPGLNELLQQMLAKLPDDRVATAAEIAERIAPMCVGSQLPRLASRSPVSSRDEWDKSRSDTAQTRPAVEILPPAEPRHANIFSRFWQGMRRQFWA